MIPKTSRKSIVEMSANSTATTPSSRWRSGLLDTADLRGAVVEHPGDGQSKSGGGGDDRDRDEHHQKAELDVDHAAFAPGSRPESPKHVVKDDGGRPEHRRTSLCLRRSLAPNGPTRGPRGESGRRWAA